MAPVIGMEMPVFRVYITHMGQGTAGKGEALAAAGKQTFHYGRVVDFVCW